MADRVVVVTGPGRVELRTEPQAPVPDGGFRVETLFSGVSAGTELSYVKGTNPYLRATWDAGLGLFRPGAPSTPYPVTRLGYMQVARVTHSRTPGVTEGQVGAMAYGHRTGHLADPLVDRFVPLPPDLDPMLGVYLAHMGPICANGLLHAAADAHGPAVRDLGDGVRGRRVAVTGAGVVALLTALFAVRHGAASVVVLDPTPA
ncbi:zinc-binding alcohol dehydrogenase, partial [Micromonospora zhanjiangensis]